MTDQVFIAIDAGGTAVKIVAFDVTGNEVAQHTADVETHHFSNGWVERDAQAFWDNTLEALRAVVADCVDYSISALACTGFGNGIFLIDAEGKATRPGIVSVDHRAQEVVNEVRASGALPEIENVVGCRLWGGQTLMQLAYLAKHEPETIARSKWALACKDFVRFQLTGTAATDPTDASGGGLVDQQTGAYATKIFARLGMSELLELLPPIFPSDACVGHVTQAISKATGIAAGTPVACSMMDVAACSLGTDALRNDVATMIAGTWSINGMLAPVITGEAHPLLNIRLDHTDRVFIAEGSPTSASNLGWFLNNGLGGALSVEQASLQVSATPVQIRRCHFLPFVFGPAPRQGSFIGLGANDDTGTMLRAVFEGVAFQHLSHGLDLGEMTGKKLPDVIRLAGGAAKSDVWAQVFADISQRRVEAIHCTEVGALGAAICASVACDVHPDLGQAATAMTRVIKRYEPNTANADFYRERFLEFQKITQQMDQLLFHQPV